MTLVLRPVAAILLVMHSRDVDKVGLNCACFLICSTRPIRFGVSLPYREREENKENARPKDTSKDDDSDADEPVLYRDDDDDDDDSQTDDASKCKMHLLLFPL